MIRISRIRERSRLRFIVEGRLSGDWVDELERCWLEVRPAMKGRRLTVELRGVTYIDDKGRRLLKRMFGDGAELRGDGVMTRGMIDEITALAESPNRCRQ